MSDIYGTPTQPPSQQDAQGPDLASQWRQWIGDPGNKAALMQFGLALSQPVGLGQNTLGHIGQAVGQAGAASDRISEEERAAQEQARKERDTDSRAESRTLMAQNAETRANAASLNAFSNQQQVESRNQLRAAQALAAQSNAAKADAQVKMLEARVAAYPSDAEARLQLAQARTEKAQADTQWAIAKSGVVEQDSQSRRMNAETRQGQLGVSQQNADTRRDLGGRRLDQGDRRLDQQRDTAGISADQRDRRNYDQEIASIRKSNADQKLLDPKAPPTPVPSFEEWRNARTRSPVPQQQPGPSAAQPGPMPPSAPKYFKVDPKMLDQFPDAQQAPDGNYYIKR